MNILIQLISTILAVMVIAKSYADYRRRNEALAVFIFWSAAWLLIVYFAYFPQSIDALSQKFNGRGSGLGRVLSLGMTFLFFIIYRVYVKAERIERKLSGIIKKQALKEIPAHKRQ